MLPLVLYDIPSKHPEKGWSPNPGKPRLVLNYKNLPFETVWIEYPDITPKLREIGASPGKLRDGRERYTLPVLNDPNTGALITDSWVIAEYLDKTYPEKPIFPRGSEGLIHAFESAIIPLQGDSLRFTILRASQDLDERSRECYVAWREADLGCKIDEWSPEGPKRDAHWRIIESDFFGSAKEWYEKVEGKWVMGDTFSYADIIFAAWSRCFKGVYRADEWERITLLHDGKWAKLLAEVEKECNLA